MGGSREIVASALVTDLALNSQALTGFAGTLRQLMGDFERQVYFSPSCSDALDSDLTLLSAADKFCGDGLHSYLTALAALADQAAAEAVRLDQELAQKLREQPRRRDDFG